MTADRLSLKVAVAGAGWADLRIADFDGQRSGRDGIRRSAQAKLKADEHPVNARREGLPQLLPELAGPKTVAIMGCGLFLVENRRGRQGRTDSQASSGENDSSSNSREGGLSQHDRIPGRSVLPNP